MSSSRITLSPDEMRLVEDLGKALGAESKIEVIRRGLILLKEGVDRTKVARPGERRPKRMPSK